MSTTTDHTVTAAPSALPAGTWRLDPVHSKIGYAVRHLGVSWFRGGFTDVSGAIEDGTITGAAAAASVTSEDESQRAHLLSPEFFDAERHPELRFRSTGVRRDGESIAVEGELTIRGVTRPVSLAGTVSGPVENAWGGTVLALELEGVVDRREFGLDWNLPLPGGGLTVANDVRITGELEFVQEA